MDTVFLQISSYPTEAELCPYMIVLNRAVFQVYARLSLSAQEASEKDKGRGDDFGTTELPQNKRVVDAREERGHDMIPISPDRLWAKFKESSFDLDILRQAVAYRFGLSLG